MIGFKREVDIISVFLSLLLFVASATITISPLPTALIQRALYESCSYQHDAIYFDLWLT